MTRINPEVLINARKSKKWSIDDLSKKSKVDRQSIHRIEKGGKKHNRKKTIEDLAKALELTEEQLTGNVLPVPVQDKEDAQDEFNSESQLNIRVSNLARNSLSFAAMRYNISPARIVEIAPLLFVWAAEASLQQRGKRLDLLKEHCKNLSEMSGQFAHLHGRVFENYNADDTLSAEEGSIKARDIFGLTLENGNVFSPLPENYEEAEDNPMVRFLGEQLSQLDDSAELSSWHPKECAVYQICKVEILNYVDGDQDAADRIHSGQAPLHKLPQEFRTKGKEAERASWIKSQGKNTFLELLK